MATKHRRHTREANCIDADLQAFDKVAFFYASASPYLADMIPLDGWSEGFVIHVHEQASGKQYRAWHYIRGNQEILFTKESLARHFILFVRIADLGIAFILLRLSFFRSRGYLSYSDARAQLNLPPRMSNFTVRCKH